MLYFITGIYEIYFKRLEICVFLNNIFTGSLWVYFKICQEGVGA